MPRMDEIEKDVTTAVSLQQDIEKKCAMMQQAAVILEEFENVKKVVRVHINHDL